MMHNKTKGSVAELAVAARLMQDGWRVLLPYGENTRYDLVAERDGRFLRVQVKYVTPKEGKLTVNCRSSNNWSVLPYTAAEIDVIAVYEAAGGAVYYVPVSRIRKNEMILRLAPTKNRQRSRVRFAADFSTLRERGPRYKSLIEA